MPKSRLLWKKWKLLVLSIISPILSQTFTVVLKAWISNEQIWNMINEAKLNLLFFLLCLSPTYMHVHTHTHKFSLKVILSFECMLVNVFTYDWHNQRNLKGCSQHVFMLYHRKYTSVDYDYYFSIFQKARIEKNDFKKIDKEKKGKLRDIERITVFKKCYQRFFFEKKRLRHLPCVEWNPWCSDRLGSFLLFHKTRYHLAATRASFPISTPEKIRNKCYYSI